LAAAAAGAPAVVAAGTAVGGDAGGAAAGAQAAPSRATVPISATRRWVTREVKAAVRIAYSPCTG